MESDGPPQAPTTEERKPEGGDGSGPSVQPQLTPEEVDTARGFTEDELQTCLKVLRAFQTRLDLLQQKEYKELRSAGIIFVEGINKRYFRGLSPEEYNHNKARKAGLTIMVRIARKERRKQEALEDQRRIAKTKMREQKIRKLERLMENSAEQVKMIENLTTPMITNGESSTSTADPLSLGIVTVPADRIATRFSSDNGNKKRKRKGKGSNDKAATNNKTPNKGQSQTKKSTTSAQPNEKRKRENTGKTASSEAQTDSTVEAKAETAEDVESLLHQPQECYICKTTYFQIHHFYDRLCPECADLNWRKRNASANLKGYIALVTGGRVKIGFETAVKLLRAGATVIVTTRFPHDAAIRFSKLQDFNEWKGRLHVYGLDMRYLQAVERFCHYLKQAYPHMDIIINNAAQTIRRPPAYYEHLIASESVNIGSLPEDIRHILQPEGLPVKPWGNDTLLPLFSGSLGILDAASASGPSPCVDMPDSEGTKHSKDADATEPITAPSTVVQAEQTNSAPGSEATALPHISAVLSQLALVKGDEDKDPRRFPPGIYDEHGQQVDLRRTNSWVLQLDQVSTVELAEVHVINALAPFTINSLLRPMMIKSPNPDRFVVNVSSVEGEFYHHKTTAHPHTNMAKASLNMMTRTAAAYYARDRIWMTAVDTGWISDMNPVQRSQRIANKYGEAFRNPIDEVDGAARILDPVYMRLNEGKVMFGKFFKDYHNAAW